MSPGAGASTPSWPSASAAAGRELAEHAQRSTAGRARSWAPSTAQAEHEATPSAAAEHAERGAGRAGAGASTARLGTSCPEPAADRNCRARPSGSCPEPELAEHTGRARAGASTATPSTAEREHRDCAGAAGAGAGRARPSGSCPAARAGAGRARAGASTPSTPEHEQPRPSGTSTASTVRNELPSRATERELPGGSWPGTRWRLDTQAEHERAEHEDRQPELAEHALAPQRPGRARAPAADRICRARARRPELPGGSWPSTRWHLNVQVEHEDRRPTGSAGRCPRARRPAVGAAAPRGHGRCRSLFEELSRPSQDRVSWWCRSRCGKGRGPARKLRLQIVAGSGPLFSSPASPLSGGPRGTYPADLQAVSQEPIPRVPAAHR